MTTVTELLDEEQQHEKKELRRGLENRHIQLIALGGAIGTEP